MRRFVMPVSTANAASSCRSNSILSVPGMSPISIPMISASRVYSRIAALTSSS